MIVFSSVGVLNDFKSRRLDFRIFYEIITLWKGLRYTLKASKNRDAVISDETLIRRARRKSGDHSFLENVTGLYVVRSYHHATYYLPKK